VAACVELPVKPVREFENEVAARACGPMERANATPTQTDNVFRGMGEISLVVQLFGIPPRSFKYDRVYVCEQKTSQILVLVVNRSTYLAYAMVCR
jgi:hypothetical protein